MLRKFGTLAVAATMGFGTAASAETHTIMIMEDAFFPEISYIEDGDKIRFVNATGSDQIVVWGDWSDEDTDDEDRWSIGPIAPDQYHQITVNTSIELEFRNYATDKTSNASETGVENGAATNDEDFTGWLTFDEPDL